MSRFSVPPQRSCQSKRRLSANKMKRFFFSFPLMRFKSAFDTKMCQNNGTQIVYLFRALHSSRKNTTRKRNNNKCYISETKFVDKNTQTTQMQTARIIYLCVYLLQLPHSPCVHKNTIMFLLPVFQRVTNSTPAMFELYQQRKKSFVHKNCGASTPFTSSLSL